MQAVMYVCFSSYLRLSEGPLLLLLVGNMEEERGYQKEQREFLMGEELTGCRIIA